VALGPFRSGRAALESARGTDLTPTRLIYFEEATEEQDVATIRPVEHRNSYAPVYSAVAGLERNTLNFKGRMTYEDFPWWGNLFFKAILTPTGAGPYVYTFLPTLTSDDHKTATIQLGYADTIAAAAAWKYNGCFGQTLNLHFEKNEDSAVLFDATLLVQKPATSITAFTGSLSDRTTTPMSTANTIVYIDAGTIGSTADPQVVSLDWTLNVDPVRFETLDGTAAANAIYRPNFVTWSATITRRYDAITERSAYVAKTIRKVRVATTTGASAIAWLDLYGAYTSRRTSEVEGIAVEELTLEPVYNATATADHILTVTNTIAALT
jgi:hypothetical protein